MITTANHSRHALQRLREALKVDPDRFTQGLYARMFAIDPDLRELFPATMTAQRDAFYRVIDHVLDVIPGESGHAELVEFLAQLGRDHRKFGVEPAHYYVMYHALMGEFAHALADSWDEATWRPISEAMMLVTGVMRGAAESAQTPAVWTAEVTEKYRISRDLAVVRLIGNAPLRYLAGQYLEVQIPQWPKEWRNLSPAIPPNPNREIEFHIRSVRRGTVSSSIVNETRVGDVWTLAQGHGTLHVNPDRPVLMVAGGTGLAPLRSIIIQMSQCADNPMTHIYYGARFPGELYDLPVLRRIAATNPWLRVTAVSEETKDPWWINATASAGKLGVEHLIGQLSDVLVNEPNLDSYQILLAGSPEMIDTTRHRLIVAGARASLIQHDPVY